MEVLARGQRVRLFHCLDRRHVWQLAGMADVVKLSPVPAPGVHSPPLLTPLTLVPCHQCALFGYHLALLLPMLAMQLTVAY